MKTQEAPGASESPWGAPEESWEYPLGRQRGLVGPPVACLSDVVRLQTGLDGRHSFGCALVTRSGACDCTTPVRRTTSRGFTYDLAVMLGEGWYDDEETP